MLLLQLLDDIRHGILVALIRLETADCGAAAAVWTGHRTGVSSAVPGEMNKDALSSGISTRILCLTVVLKPEIRAEI